MRIVSLLGAIALSTLCAGAANATVTVYTSQAAFTAAAGAATNIATFESFTDGSKGSSIVDSGILFTSLPGGHPVHDVYTARPNNLTNSIQNTSFVLTANGDENFQMQLNSGATFGSIGFDFISNRYGNPTISLFGVGDAFLGSFTITTVKNAKVYFGAISDIAILYARTTVDRGYIEDTAYDNVAIGPVIAVAGAVPEPSSWVLLIGGFGIAGGAMRYRRRLTRVGFA